MIAKSIEAQQTKADIESAVRSFETRFPSVRAPSQYEFAEEKSQEIEAYAQAMNKLFRKLTEGNGDARLGAGLTVKDHLGTFNLTSIRAMPESDRVVIDTGGITVQSDGEKAIIDIEIALWHEKRHDNGGVGSSRHAFAFDDRNKLGIKREGVLTDVDGTLDEDSCKAIVLKTLRAHAPGRPSNDHGALFQFALHQPDSMRRIEFAFSRHGSLALRIHVEDPSLARMAIKQVGIW